jgi:hypothetical protein
MTSAHGEEGDIMLFRISNLSESARDMVVHWYGLTHHFLYIFLLLWLD